jgi:hypothetical protein
MVTKEMATIAMAMTHLHTVESLFAGTFNLRFSGKQPFCDFREWPFKHDL